MIHMAGFRSIRLLPFSRAILQSVRQMKLREAIQGSIRQISNKPVGGITIAILLTLSALMGWYGMKNPQHSWDTIPYVALVLSLDGVPEENLHSETYRRLQASLPSESYNAFVSGTSRRKEVSINPLELKAILPFWTIKPLYLWSTYGIVKFGVEVVQATTVVSTLSTMILSLLLGAWILRHFTNYMGLAVASAVAIASGLPHLLGLARPDGLSTLLIFSCIFILTEYKYSWLASLFAVVAVAARPDNIVIASMICLYISIATPGASMKRDRIIGTLSLISAILVYIIIQHASGAYGWKTTFYVSFIEPSSLALLQQDLTITPFVYIKVLYWSVLESVATLPFMLFVLFNTIAVIVAHNSFGRDQLRSHILLMLVMANIVHWFAFPSFELRFFVASYLAIACITLTIIKTNLNPLKVE